MVAVARDRVPITADDREVWDAIIRQHHHRVVVSLLALGLRPARAHEIANEAWARLVEKRQAGELETMTFPGLVLAQARFLGLDALREAARERRRRAGLDAIRELEAPDESPVFDQTQLDTIRAALATCSAQAQRVFRVVYAHPGVPHARLADKLGLSVQRLRQILYDVRRAVRSSLEEEHE